MRYQRGVEAVRWLDMAFYPVRKAAYRATLGRHHLAIGKAQLEQQKWMEGIMSLRAAVAYAPELSEARRILADYYVAIKRPDLALQMLESGLTSARNDAAYLRHLFQLYQDTGEFVRAVETAGRLLPDAPEFTAENRFVALQAATALLRLGRVAESEALVSRWRLQEITEGQLLLADLALAGQQVESAVRRLEVLLAKEPDNEVVALRLTHLYLEQMRTLDARRVALMRSIARPDSPGARIDLLNIDLELGRRDDFERGVDDFLKAFGTDAAALRLLAKVAAVQARPDVAARLLTVAGEAGHEASGFRFGLMHAQCAAGNYADALVTAQEIDQRDQPAGRAAVSLMAFKCWAYCGTENQAEGDAWLHRFISQKDFAIGDALGLAANLEKLSAPTAAGKVLIATAERPEAGSAVLVSFAGFLVRQQDWVQAKALLPRLKALADPPTDLIGTIEANTALFAL